jgi:oligoribonuclease (3'-5' exoribonuclease)
MNQHHTPIAFTDCETTHLEATHGEAWEVAVIRRDSNGDTEHLWQIRPDVAKADPEALRIGGYPRRFVVPEHAEAAYIEPSGLVRPAALEWVTGEIWTALEGAVMVGSNPGFDDRFLRKLLGSAPWHYRPIDFATLAAGFMWAVVPDVMAKDPRPISSRWLSSQVGVEPPSPDVAHTALGDARWARDVFDAVTGGAA